MLPCPREPPIEVLRAPPIGKAVQVIRLHPREQIAGSLGWICRPLLRHVPSFAASMDTRPCTITLDSRRATGTRREVAAPMTATTHSSQTRPCDSWSRSERGALRSPAACFRPLEAGPHSPRAFSPPTHERPPRAGPSLPAPPPPPRPPGPLH